MAGVGHAPKFPLMTVGPVFVTPDPANTAKLSAVPSPTGASWALVTLVTIIADKPSMRPTTAKRPLRARPRFSFINGSRSTCVVPAMG